MKHNLAQSVALPSTLLAFYCICINYHCHLTFGYLKIRKIEQLMTIFSPIITTLQKLFGKHILFSRDNDIFVITVIIHSTTKNYSAAWANSNFEGYVSELFSPPGDDEIIKIKSLDIILTFYIVILCICIKSCHCIFSVDVSVRIYGFCQRCW